jgi:hypothetical protein
MAHRRTRSRAGGGVVGAGLICPADLSGWLTYPAELPKIGVCAVA